MIDPDDADHRTFMDVGGVGRLSHAAFRLHSFAVMNSALKGRPGFVSDDYLNAIAAETTVTAMELVVAGVWERRNGGYRVVAETR